MIAKSSATSSFFGAKSSVGKNPFGERPSRPDLIPVSMAGIHRFGCAVWMCKVDDFFTYVYGVIALVTVGGLILFGLYYLYAALGK